MKQMNRALMVAMIAGSCSMVSASAWALDPAPCASDADCGEGIACESGYCAVEQPLPAPSECEADADCAAGYSCQVVGASGCAPSPDGLPQEPCVSEEFRACVPPPPAQCDPARLSADCSGGDVCVTYTFETCSGGAAPDCICADGVDCECDVPEPPEPSECQTEAVSYCVPPYLAPCSVDLDCGAGFTCEQQEVCTSSCADLPREPGDEDPGNGTCESSCAPSGQSYCQLVERACDSAADCGAGFVCESFSYPSPGVPGTCSVDPDGTEVCDDGGPVEPPPAESYCLPEGWQTWGAPSGGGSYGPDSPISSNQDGEVVGAESARAPRQDGSGFPATNDGSASGCQVGAAGGAAGSGLSLLALIAGVFGLRRRRD